MTKEVFIERFVDEIEVEDEKVTVDTNIKDLDEWDSMAAMVLIGFVSDEFGVTLNSDDLKDITTIQSLMDRIGLEKFN